MPRRRTFAAAFLASALSMLPVLRHPWLRWPATPALRALASPPRIINQEGRGRALLSGAPYHRNRSVIAANTGSSTPTL
jgi:hypothetical protein